MSDEVPLSEFVTEEEPDTQAAAAPDDPPDDTEQESGADARPVESGTVSPAEPTSVYDPAGSSCEGCGETVNRRIQTDDGLRCLECVPWTPEQ